MERRSHEQEGHLAHPCSRGTEESYLEGQGDGQCRERRKDQRDTRRRMSLALCGQEAPGGLSLSSVSDVVDGAESQGTAAAGGQRSGLGSWQTLGHSVQRGSIRRLPAAWLSLAAVQSSTVLPIPRAAPGGSVPSSDGSLGFKPLSCSRQPLLRLLLDR